MKISKILLFGCLALIASPTISRAQEIESQGQDFFQRDFANQGFGDAAEPGSATAEQPPRTGMARPGLEAPAPGIVPKLKPISKMAKTGGLEVQSIGMYVSGVDPEHLRKSLKTLVDFSIKHQLSLERIQTLGASKLPKDSAFDHLMAAVWILDGQFSPLKKLPEVYKNLKSSPAWLINTKEGQYVLEAPSNPEAYFDEDGLFVPRKPTVVKEDLIEKIE